MDGIAGLVAGISFYKVGELIGGDFERSTGGQERLLAPCDLLGRLRRIAVAFQVMTG